MLNVLNSKIPRHEDRKGKFQSCYPLTIFFASEDLALCPTQLGAVDKVFSKHFQVRR